MKEILKKQMELMKKAQSILWIVEGVVQLKGSKDRPSNPYREKDVAHLQGREDSLMLDYTSIMIELKETI